MRIQWKKTVSRKAAKAQRKRGMNGASSLIRPVDLRDESGRGLHFKQFLAHMHQVPAMRQSPIYRITPNRDFLILKNFAALRLCARKFL